MNSNRKLVNKAHTRYVLKVPGEYPSTRILLPAYFFPLHSTTLVGFLYADNALSPYLATFAADLTGLFGASNVIRNHEGSKPLEVRIQNVRARNRKHIRSIQYKIF